MIALVFMTATKVMSQMDMRQTEGVSCSVQARYGVMHVASSSDLISQSIVNYGEWAENELRFLQQFLHSGATCVDVGAFLGSHALAFSSFVGDQGSVICFEPNPPSFKLLMKNVAENKLGNVHAYNLALGSSDGFIISGCGIVNHANNEGSFSISPNAAVQGNAVGETIAVRRLDSFELASCDLIKIDAEGFEARVIEGASSTISKHKPTIYAECNTLQGGLDVISCLRKQAYDTYAHLSDPFNPNNYHGVSKDIFGRAKEVALVGVPQHRSEQLQKHIGQDFFQIADADDLAYVLLLKPQFIQESIHRRAIYQLGGATAAEISIAGLVNENGQFRQENLSLRAAGSISEAKSRSFEAVLARLEDAYRSLKNRVNRIDGAVSTDLLDITSSPYFDADFYREAYPDLSELNEAQLARHYLEHGGAERRDPSAQFSSAAYLSEYEDVMQAGINPLLHYERYGRKEGRTRRTTAEFKHHRLMPPIASMLQKPEVAAFSVSVVIPTYNAGDEFQSLLRKLKAQQGLMRFEIIIVDSGSSDDTINVAENCGCIVMHIKKEDFSHSYARNIGAEQATCDFILFMVQDAYPIGNNWLFYLASALNSFKAQGGVALSCAEYPRADCDILYSILMLNHYKFLGCSENDRIGYLIGDDQLSLRQQGQLSDVSCLIIREVFSKYRYEGRYAEDLMLGVKLIKAGYQVAMLSSLRVIHSHARNESYYLKRSFVDVIFLHENFPEPARNEITFGGIAIANWYIERAISELTEGTESRRASLPDLLLHRLATKFGDATVSSEIVRAALPPLLQQWLCDAPSYDLCDPIGTDYATVTITISDFLGRLDAIRRYVDHVYPRRDPLVDQKVLDAVQRSLAMSIGSQIGFFYISGKKLGATGELAMLRELMLDGV